MHLFIGCKPLMAEIVHDHLNAVVVDVGRLHSEKFLDELGYNN